MLRLTLKPRIRHSRDHKEIEMNKGLKIAAALLLTGFATLATPHLPQAQAMHTKMARRHHHKARHHRTMAMHARMMGHPRAAARHMRAARHQESKAMHK